MLGRFRERNGQTCIGRDCQQWIMPLGTFVMITGKDITCERFTVDTCDTIKHEAQALGLSQDKASLDDLRKFEQAIDRARRGQLVTLFDYFHIEPELINLPEETYRIRDDIGIIIEMKTDNWKQQIPYVMKKIKELKELGY